MAKKASGKAGRKPDPPPPSPKKPNILVLYQMKEKPFHEKSPTEQLKDLGFVVTEVGFYEFISPILGETLGKTHSTTILLSDAVVLKNPADPQTYDYSKVLASTAKKHGIRGVGIMTDSDKYGQPFKGTKDGVALVVSRECRQFNQRDWKRLLALVRKEMAAAGLSPKLQEPPDGAEPSAEDTGGKRKD